MLRLSVASVWTALAAPNRARNTSAILIVLSTAGVSAQAGTAATPQTSQANPQPVPAVDAKTDERARAQFEEGRTAYEEGRYRDAWAKFREAYRLSGRPELLYDVGQTADRLGREEDAIKAFELYLKHTPDAPNRREVENRLRALRARVAGAARSQSAQQTALPNSTASRTAALPQGTSSVDSARPEYPPRTISAWPEPEAEIARPNAKRAPAPAKKPSANIDASKGVR